MPRSCGVCRFQELFQHLQIKMNLRYRCSPPLPVWYARIVVSMLTHVSLFCGVFFPDVQGRDTAVSTCKERYGTSATQAENDIITLLVTSMRQPEFSRVTW